MPTTADLYNQTITYAVSISGGKLVFQGKLTARGGEFNIPGNATKAIVDWESPEVAASSAATHLVIQLQITTGNMLGQLKSLIVQYGFLIRFHTFSAVQAALKFHWVPRVINLHNRPA